MRQRRDLIEQSSSHILKMKQALTAMNVRLDLAVSDITGQTGMSILRAMVAGEHDPAKLAEMRNGLCAKSQEQIEDALRGHFTDEHLFVLSQALELWDRCRTLIAGCDRKIEEHAGVLVRKEPVEKAPAPRRQEHVRKNVFPFQARELFFSILGTDLTQIDGVSTTTVAVFLSEVGTNVDAWPTEKHFASWLRLSPGSNKSGGRVRSSRNARTTNRLTTALRVAAQALERSQSAMGAFYRRLKARMGPQKAINAAAHRLATHIYFAVKRSSTYLDPGPHYYEQRNRAKALSHLQRNAARLGFKLVEAA